MKYKKRKKAWKTAINNLPGGCVTPDSLSAEVAAPYLKAHNASHGLCENQNTSRAPSNIVTRVRKII